MTHPTPATTLSDWPANPTTNPSVRPGKLKSAWKGTQAGCVPECGTKADRNQVRQETFHHGGGAAARTGAARDVPEKFNLLATEHSQHGITSTA